MIHHPNDIPVTYLNKGHQYMISITDSQPPLSTNGVLKYQTSIRVTFEEPAHASNPAACWGLWKETRGHELHPAGSNLHAVEMVNLNQENKDQSCLVQLERTSLDGFCVTWYANPTSGSLVCQIGVRFNFLSTDFSHSKGVKGAPLRLCAKTELMLPLPGDAEISFCNVKLFRDHGAERKMFNDVSQLKRAIEKRKADFVKPNGSVNLGKRKRDRRLSYTSDIFTECELQSNLDAELTSMQGIFHSNRPVTNFCRKGEQKDDPDLFPIEILAQRTIKSQHNQQTVTPPLSSSISIWGSSNNSADPQLPDSYPGTESLDWDSHSHSSIKHSSVDGFIGHSELASSNTSVSPVPSMPSTGDVDPMKIDPKYRVPGAPSSGPTQDTPARCLYLQFQQHGMPQNDYHTAVYLTVLTVNELAAKISQKQNFSPDQQLRLFHVKPNNMKVILDDDSLQRIPEGQAMTAEVSEFSTDVGSMPALVDVRLYF